MVLYLLSQATHELICVLGNPFHPHFIQWWANGHFTIHPKELHFDHDNINEVDLTLYQKIKSYSDSLFVQTLLCLIDYLMFLSIVRDVTLVKSSLFLVK